MGGAAGNINRAQNGERKSNGGELGPFQARNYRYVTDRRAFKDQWSCTIPRPSKPFRLQYF